MRIRRVGNFELISDVSDSGEFLPLLSIVSLHGSLKDASEGVAVFSRIRALPKPILSYPLLLKHWP